MTPVLLLCRHGNTFEKGQRAFMVGAREDLPLTEEGLAQARRVGDAISSSGISPHGLACGPLARTRVYADVIAGMLPGRLEPRIDERLRELDYGAWSGLTNEQIRERFGPDELESWNEKGMWPSSVRFSPSEPVVRAEIGSFLDESSAAGGLSVVVTSSGRLRIFGQLCSNGLEGLSPFKMNTGASSIVVYSAGRWTVSSWNIGAERLTEELRKLPVCKSRL